MNYEEMLNNRDGVATQKAQTPLGLFYKKQIDRKYRHIIELRPLLAENMVFCECLRNDQEQGLKIRDHQQLHYELHEDSGGIYELELEPGQHQTLAQLLADNPAVVAANGFISDSINELIDITAKLNDEGIYQVCYAPEILFVAKSDSHPRLLIHGSSFLKLNTAKMLFKDFEEWIAPEVLENGSADERSDVYGLAKLIEKLHESGSMPLEYKKVMKKATDPDPAKRYASVKDMQNAISNIRSTKRSAILLLVAVIIAALGIFLYFDLTPETTVLQEEVHPEKQKSSGQDDDFMEGFDDASMGSDEDLYDPDVLELIGIDPDSVDLSALSEEEWKQVSDSANQMVKAEQIFRKRFREEAEKELAKIYNNAHMGNRERDILARQTMDNLMKKKEEMANQAGLNQDQADRVYSDVISKLTEEHSTRQNYGYIRPKESE